MIWTLLLKILPTDVQLSLALRLWGRSERELAIRVARSSSVRSDIAKVVLAQWLLYSENKPSLAAQEEGVSLLKSAAQSGSMEAHQVLASCYLNGEGVSLDVSFAVRLLEIAGKGGRLSAWEDLVHIFTNGKYVAPDYSRAACYADALADAGYPQMQRALRAETL